jgi:hypothetical protein
MILDALLLFDPSNTSIISGGASTNTLDFGAGRDVGVDDDGFFISLNIQQTFAGPSNSTLNVQVQSSVDNTNFYTLIETGAIAVANLVSGKAFLRTKFPADQPAITVGPGRYYRLNYVVANGPFTAGQVEAALVRDLQANITYAEGFNPAN